MSHNLALKFEVYYFIDQMVLNLLFMSFFLLPLIYNVIEVAFTSSVSYHVSQLCSAVFYRLRLVNMWGVLGNIDEKLRSHVLYFLSVIKLAIIQLWKEKKLCLHFKQNDSLVCIYFADMSQDTKIGFRILLNAFVKWETR